MVRIMCAKEQIDALAERINKEIENYGSCNLQNTELSLLWGGASTVPTAETRMHLTNFSVQYGFVHRADPWLSIVSFRKLA